MRRTLVAGLLVFGLATGAARVAPQHEAPPVLADNDRAEAFDTLGAGHGTTAWNTALHAYALDLLRPDRTDGASTDAALSIRRISRDTSTAFDAQHETQVEPASLGVGSTIVTAFQNGRYENGGAAAIGWATTTDAGKHWWTGAFAQSRYGAVSDPVVAYDAIHRWWLVAALGQTPTGVELWLSRSRDGLGWSAPIVAAADPAEEYDKEWITCDSGNGSPYRGRCYLVYVEFDARQLGVRRSLDGGATWSSATTVAPGTGPLVFTAPFPVVRPDGTLVIPYSVFPQDASDRIAAIVSRDGGTSFGPPATVATVDFEEDADVRAEVMPSAAVDAAGQVYAVWSDSTLRDDGGANDILFSSSTTGVAWTAPTRIPLKRTTAGVAVSYLLPAIAVAPKGSGRNAKLAVVLYSLRLRNGCEVFLPGCTKQVEAWLVRSDDGGATWATPKSLTATPMMLDWLASSGRGAMIGDYVSISWAGGKPWAIVPLATRSAFGYSQSIFAATA